MPFSDDEIKKEYENELSEKEDLAKRPSKEKKKDQLARTEHIEKGQSNTSGLGQR